MSILKNEMVETACPLGDAVTKYTESIIFIQNRAIDSSIYGQDIAATKMERISASSHFTHSREATSHRHDLNLWR